MVHLEDWYRLFDNPIHPERVREVPPLIFIAKRYTVRKLCDDRRSHSLNGLCLEEFDADEASALTTHTLSIALAFVLPE